MMATTGNTALDQAAPLHKDPDVRSAVLQQCLGELYCGLSEVGKMPTQPPTARGRLGAALVRLVRRSLFWFIPQLDRFHLSVVQMLESQAEAIEQLVAANRQLDEALGRTLEEFALRHEAIQRQLAALPRLHGEAAAPRAPDDAAPVTLAACVRVVRAAGTGTPGSPLVDLFSGRGAWLALLKEEGLDGWGVEPEDGLAAQCQASGLHVAAADPVVHLSGLAAGSLGGVSVFRALYSLSLDRFLALLDAAARALRPGAVLIIGEATPAREGHGRTGPLAPLLQSRGFIDIETLPSGGIIGWKPK